MKCKVCNQTLFCRIEEDPIYDYSEGTWAINKISFCPSCNEVIERKIPFKPRLSIKQQDKICFLIGEWYIFTKGDYLGTHHLGRDKEKLKSLLCSSKEVPGEEQDPDTFTLNSFSKNEIRRVVMEWAENRKNGYNTPEIFMENATSLCDILCDMQFFLSTSKILKLINQRMQDLSENEGETTDFQYGQLVAFDLVKNLLRNNNGF